jgi:hypothetical protein
MKKKYERKAYSKINEQIVEVDAISEKVKKFPHWLDKLDYTIIKDIEQLVLFLAYLHDHQLAYLIVDMAVVRNRLIETKDINLLYPKEVARLHSIEEVRDLLNEAIVESPDNTHIVNYFVWSITIESFNRDLYYREKVLEVWKHIRRGTSFIDRMKLVLDENENLNEVMGFKLGEKDSIDRIDLIPEGFDE